MQQKFDYSLRYNIPVWWTLASAMCRLPGVHLRIPMQRATEYASRHGHPLSFWV